MTYRERREAKAERLRGWADKRTATATVALESQPELRHDWAFITQPGHIPERARMNARDDRAFESLAKAESMTSRAAGIESQLDHAIYDDDPDAIERIRERIAGLEAKRDRMKSANAEYRKSHRAELAVQTNLYLRGQMTPHPSYSITNIGGNIGRYRDRLKALEHPAPTWFHASRRDPSTCYKCDQPQDEHTQHPNVPSVLMCPTGDARK
jgi:hypothetical protein